MRKNTNKTDELSHAVARLHAGILSFVFAVIFGFGFFTVTGWLLIKGGQNVGLHLNLLRNYFIGYSVSWVGSIVGLFYGLILGGIIGWSIGMVYNRIVGIRQK